jgi:hypothetical protein
MLIKMNSGRILLALSLPLCFAGAAQAQTPFQIVAQSGTNTAPVANGSTLTLSAGAVGQTTSTTITLTYEGSTSVVVSPPTLSSTNGFGIGSSSITSTPLQFGQAVSFTVTYTPTTAAQATSQLTVPFTQSGANSNSAGTVGSLTFILSGTAPEMVVAYALSTNGNVTTVANGSTIAFPSTVVGSSSTATIIIANQGSGPGAIQAISVSGTGFSLQSLPLLPVQSLAANSNVQFSVLYAPTQTGTNSGTLEIDFPNQKIMLGLQGTAIASLFTYQLVQGTQTSALVPGQTVPFPDTNVGSQSPVTILMQNTSSTPVSNISAAVSGAGFSITDEPILPITLNVNGTASFTITFAPTQSGTVTGRFRVGNDSFNLSATAIGVQLVYSYASGSASTTVVSGGTVAFPPETVGQSESTTFTIQNNGTTPAQVTSIGVSGTQTTPPIFSLPSLPQLPLSLPAGQNVQFTITFAPQTTGQSTAPLVINDQQFTLSGFGNAPATIPSYQFTGASGAQTALTQAAVGLSLSSPYPLALNGKLTLTANTGSLPADPSVQFSSGGQSVTFTIPQGATQAVFPSGGNQISLQTGSVAGTITVTPSFALASGLDVTPASPPTLSLSVPSGPVVLTSALVSAKTATSLTLQVTGYATTRDLATLAFQFTPQSSTNLSNSSVSLNIAPNAQVWFSSRQSYSFGGQFSVSVPFTLSNGQTSTSTSTTSLVSLLKSVSVTATNSAGTSTPVVASLTQ